MQHFWIEVGRPSEANPGGEIAEAQFEVVKGQVVVTGMDGRPIGKKPAKGDPLTIAKRILRDGKPKQDFYRKLDWPSRGIY